MKTSSLLSVFFVGAALIITTSGCQHHGVATTVIPDRRNGIESPGPSDLGNAGTGNVVSTTPPVTGQPIPVDPNSRWKSLFEPGGADQDREKFKDDTVYFDLDSATIKKSEEKKLETVANYFKDNTTDALRVEGNCDERGTEKYNLSLGDRRAMAVREYLNNLGVDPQRIQTITFGAAHPVDPGHNEAAWKKNRRGDLVLLTPKK